MNAPTVTIVRANVAGHHFLLADADEDTRKPPIVFLHGAGGGAWHWDNVLRYFAERQYPSYAPDLIGHGSCTEPIRTAGIHDYVADIRHFLERVVLVCHSAPPIVIGHSMGGLIAQKVAEGGDVAATVLVTTAPPHGIAYRPGGALDITLGDLVAAFSSLLITGESLPLSRSFVASVFADPERSAAVIDRFVSSRFAESPVALKELLLGEIAVSPSAINAPLLVVGAGKDRVIHPDIAGEVAAFYGAPLMTMHQLGHACIMEAGWEATATFIERWIAHNV